MFGVSDLLERAGHPVVPFSVRYAQNVPSPWSPYFVSPIAGEDAVYFREHARTPGVLLKSLERALYSPEVHRSLTRLVRAERPDVALVLHYLRKLSPSVLTALRDNGVPIVVRLSDFAMVCPQAHLVRDGRVCEACVGATMLPSVRHRCVQGSLSASAVNAAAMVIARRLGWFDSIDRFIAPSSVMKEKMATAGYDTRRIVHLPTFVALKTPDPAPERQRRIVYVGRLEPVKGAGVLVEAFFGLRRDSACRDVQLVIVGDDTTPYAQRLKDRVHELRLENVVFTGAMDQPGVAEVLSSSALSVVPSVCHENLPNSLLESLACGTPVVGSDISAIEEAVGGGEAGALFRMGDPGDLTRVLGSLLSDRSRLERMSQSARTLASTRYSPSRHVEGLVAVLGEVAGARSSAPRAAEWAQSGPGAGGAGP